MVIVSSSHYVSFEIITEDEERDTKAKQRKGKGRVQGNLSILKGRNDIEFVRREDPQLSSTPLPPFFSFKIISDVSKTEKQAGKQASKQASKQARKEASELSE
ncbi:hypothetical protein HZH66_014466 [Vespula vulgaris]|uniref:Uncharacterized protein n=1 Tax=Vespula vulgaris TaxID=7454 RepID=A0A834J2T3_VESVU|nr:hypothetical protein HZH66_014466 [Vespula vulgaris]